MRRTHAFGNMTQISRPPLRIVAPRPSARPTLRLRDRSPVAVRIRSPMPVSPIKVSARAPSATPKRVISARPRVIRAARALSPSSQRVRDAGGDRHDILDGPADFDPDHVVGRINSQRSAVQRIGHALAKIVGAPATVSAAGKLRATSIAKLGPESGPTSGDRLILGARSDAAIVRSIARNLCTTTRAARRVLCRRRCEHRT